MKAGDVLDVCGGYRLVRPLGTGGFAEVWEAESVHGGIKAALKILLQSVDNEDTQREMQSLEIVKNVRHPYLLQTRDFARWNDRLVIVMDLADRSLRDRLKEYAREYRCGLPADELCRYFFEAAEALDYLHGLNILHRDIKPDNLLLRSGHIVVCDFGLVRLKDRLMMSVSSSGTPAYMAPETWQGKAGAGTDQYALAATYAELRLNRRPFGANDYAGIMIDHLQSQPVLDPMPFAEQQVILRAMSKDPTQRFSSCQAMMQALAAVIPGVATSQWLVGTGSLSPGTQVTDALQGGTAPGGHPTVNRPGAPPTMPRGDFPQITNLAPQPGVHGQATVGFSPEVNTPASLHGHPTLDSPPPRPGSAPPSPAQTLDAAYRPAPDINYSLNPQGPVPSGGGVPGPAQPPPGYAPPGYAPQSYPPQQYPGGVSDVFVEVTPGMLTNQNMPPPSPYPGVPSGMYAAPPTTGGSKLPLISVLIGLSGLLMLVTAGVAWYLLQPKPGGFAVNAPAEMRVQRGGSTTGKVTIVREGGSRGKIALTFSGGSGLKATSDGVTTDGTEAEVRFEAAAGAPTGAQKLTATATPEQGKAVEFEWVVVVEAPAGTTPWLPPGYVAAGDQTLQHMGKAWYRQIQKKLPGSQAVVFCFVPHGNGVYIGQDKVSNEVYRQFATESRSAAGTTWEKGGWAAGQDLGNSNGRLPALRMSQREAEAAARWMGGQLPTAEQLDAAAGKDTGALGPAQGQDVAVNRRDQGPREVGTSSGDRSPHGVRDLAGNGWEWTATEVDAAGTRQVVLRGQRYTAARPLLFADLETGLSCNPEHASPLIGFRVAIPVR